MAQLNSRPPKPNPVCGQEAAQKKQKQTQKQKAKKRSRFRTRFDRKFFTQWPDRGMK